MSISKGYVGAEGKEVHGMVWEELKEDLIFTCVEARSIDEVFDQLGGALVRAGYGRDDYVQALKDREGEYPTGLNVNGIGIAIPHTPVDYANGTATCIGVLKEPVTFLGMGTDEEVPVKLVFTLCVTDPHAHIGQLKQIVLIIQDGEVLQRLIGSKDPKEIIQIIKDKEQALEFALGGE